MAGFVEETLQKFQDAGLKVRWSWCVAHLKDVKWTTREQTVAKYSAAGGKNIEAMAIVGNVYNVNDKACMSAEIFAADWITRRMQIPKKINALTPEQVDYFCDLFKAIQNTIPRDVHGDPIDLKAKDG